MEPSHKSSAGPDMLVVLGISAIDVLCCALVCSLVLFLMLSQASSGGAVRGKGRNKDLLIAFEVPAAPGTAKQDWPVLRVRVFEPTAGAPKGKGNGTPLLFWGDDREVIVPNATTPLSPNLAFAGRGQVLWTSDDIEGVDTRLSVLQIHNPKPGYWGVEIAYVDSKAGLITPAKPDMAVKVSISGAVNSRFTAQLNLDSDACILGADGCQIRNSNGPIAESLHVLASK